MQCLNCGRDSQSCLCEACRSQDILDKIIMEILYYKDDTCENEFLRSFMHGFENPRDARTRIPELLSLFDEETAAFSRCRYDAILKQPGFEQEALAYLDTHPDWDWRRQWITLDLLRSYARVDFVKPRPWCDEILKMGGLSAELYESAAQYYGFVAEYDLAEQAAEKMRACRETDMVLFTKFDSLPTMYERLMTDLTRYRTKKHYWPATEMGRRNLAPILDQKGIAHPRVTLRPKKVAESDFTPIDEWYGDPLKDYCAFWCEEVPSFTAPVKDIFQTAAVRVRGGAMVEEFQSLVRPWKSTGWQSALQSLLGGKAEAVTSADDVDLVIKAFFRFVQDDVLVSTQALGNQGKLLSRAARYSGMTEIPNQFLDLLDYAADCSEEFDLENNTRAYLLNHFALEEGQDAGEKAKANVFLYEKLKELEA